MLSHAFEEESLAVAPVSPPPHRAVSPAAVALAASPNTGLSPLWIALLLLTVLTVSRVHSYYGAVGRMRPALLLFAFAVAYVFIRPRVLNARNLLRPWPGKVVIALGVFSCFSAVFGISLGSSATFIIDSYSKTIIYACLMMLAFRGWQDVRRLVWAYVVGAAILVWLSLFVFGISKTSRGLSYDANDAGLVLLVALPLTLLVFQTSRRMGKLLSAPVLFGIVVTIAKTSSRGAFLGLLLVGAAMLVTLHGVSIVRRVIILGLVAGVVAVGAPSGYWDLMGTLKNPKADYNWDSKNGRREIAKRGIGYMLAYPLFGIGIRNFARAEGMISDKAQNTPTGEGIRWVTAHNSYVQVGAEMGIPGLLLWSSLVFGGIAGCYRIRRRIPGWWRRGAADERFLFQAAVYLPIALLGFAVPAFFVSFAYMDPIYVLAALVSGLYLAVGRRLRVSPTQAAAAARGHQSAPRSVVAPVLRRLPRT